jgi:hypothetical protein
MRTIAIRLRCNKTTFDEKASNKSNIFEPSSWPMAVFYGVRVGLVHHQEAPILDFRLCRAAWFSEWDVEFSGKIVHRFKAVA